MITNNEDIIQELIIHPNNYKPVSSNHFTNSFRATLPVNYQQSPQTISDYSKANYSDLCNFLSEIDLSVCELLPDIDSIWNYIKDCITTGMHIFIPKIKISSQTPKWYISNICHQIKCLGTLQNKYKHHPTNHNHIKVITAEKDLQTSIQAAKTDFEDKLVQDFAIILKYFSTLKALQSPALSPVQLSIETVLPVLTLIKQTYLMNIFILFFHSALTLYHHLVICLLPASH